MDAEKQFRKIIDQFNKFQFSRTSRTSPYPKELKDRISNILSSHSINEVHKRTNISQPTLKYFLKQTSQKKLAKKNHQKKSNGDPFIEIRPLLSPADSVSGNLEIELHNRNMEKLCIRIPTAHFSFAEKLITKFLSAGDKL